MESNTTPALAQRSRAFYQTLALGTFTLVVVSSLFLSHSTFSRGVDELAIVTSRIYTELSRTQPPPHAQKDFFWDALIPSETLVWHGCYVKYQCSRLTVPLNHSEPSGVKAAIAMIRIPSPLGLNKNPEYRGPLLINPGGPGGSGVDMLLRSGEYISTIVGPQFDILGFDPRGVGRSTPRASFFETALERKLWDNPLPLNIVNATSDGLARTWARAKIDGQLAWERQKDVLGHINTEQTARDVLSIVLAHGREKLVYWGLSYGTTLGVTFASMFPDNVERLVLDGVMDFESYYKGYYATSLLDTDKTMNTFYTSCHVAGPSLCAFYAPTPALISANLSTLYTSVLERPVPVRTPNGGYGLVDYNRLRMTVFTSLYKPYEAYPTLARALAALAQGDGAPLYAMMDTGVTPQCEYGEGGKADIAKVVVVRDGLTTIACNDGDWVPEEFEELEKYFEETTRKSEWGKIWVSVRAGCVGWPRGFPKAQFRGPFEGNTSFPILFVGNTADPVTPLWGAKKAAKGFPGSVVLTQDSPGHCSIAAPSICTAAHIRAYFTEGTLPPPDTVCSVDGSPFDPVPPRIQGTLQSTPPRSRLKGEDISRPMQKQDVLIQDDIAWEVRTLSDSVWRLSKTYELPMPFGIQ